VSASYAAPFWRMMLCSAVAAILVGCGGSKDSTRSGGAAAKPADQADPANAQPPQNPADQPPVAATESPKKEPPKPVKKQHAGLDPSTDPRDVFELLSGEPPFELATGSEGQSPADTFAVIVPPKGIDSTNFKYEVPTTDSPTSTSGTKKVEAKPVDAKKKPKTASAAKDDSTDEKILPSGFKPIAGAGVSRLGWPLRIRCGKDRAEMALVTGGAVTVGHDGGPRESSPQITVVLDTFYMDVAEVTVGQYERFRKLMKEERKRTIPLPENSSAPPDRPVLGVTLLQAEFYARWAGKEIPTEAEWERAARGEGTFDHPWGNGRAIWKQARSQADIGPIKSFPTDVSPFGIYDLAGNAREWCLDRYSPSAFADASKSSSHQLRNWKGPRLAIQAEFHVVKGNGPHWDAWYRQGLNATQRHPDVGFRCVLRLPDKSE
jgi:formylglycine-generating enzyme